MNCREASEHIATDATRDGRWTLRLAVRFHLLLCRTCRAYASQLRALGVAGRRLSETPPPDSERMAHLEDAIFRETSGREPNRRS